MNELVLQYGTWFSIAIRVISTFLLLFYCIPLQVKEASVKNGLRALRYQLLAFGILLIIINIATIILLVGIINVPARLPNSWLQIINALAFFGIAIIGNRMYHSQYTDEIKEMHEEFARKE